MRKLFLYFSVVTVLIALLSGCSIIQNAKRYETGLINTRLNSDLTKKYRNSTGSKPALYLPASKRFAYLEEDTGDLFIPHAYTTKQTLRQWDDIFQRFLDWKPTPDETIELTDPVTTDRAFNLFGSLNFSVKAKFINIRGKKHLVFIQPQLPPFSDDIMAYDEGNVIKMRELYQSLNDVLVD